MSNCSDISRREQVTFDKILMMSPLY